MEISTIEWSMVAFVLVQTIGFAKYVAGLSTRVAVLEASHDATNETLKEIRQDVKELLRNIK